MTFRAVVLVALLAATSGPLAQSDPGKAPPKVTPKITAPEKPMAKKPVEEPKEVKPTQVVNPNVFANTGLIAIDLRPTYSYYEASTDGMGSDVRTAHTFAPGALQGFKLSYLRDDHQIKLIGLMNEAGETRAGLSDQNGGDRFTSFARYRMIDTLPATTLSSQSCTSCALPFRNQPADTVAVLAGFWLERQTPDDLNVRSFSVELDQTAKVARVSLTNDGARPFGGPRRAEVPIRVLVQVIYVPSRYVAGQHKLKGDYSPGVEMWTNLVEGDALNRISHAELSSLFGDRAVLQGFSFTFGNADHFLKTVLVDLWAHPDLIHIQDANTDDPYKWSIDAAVLVPGR
jgi:hypothetical protein